MTFKSTTPPLCRQCGKAIAKHTHGAWFGVTVRQAGTKGDYAERPHSRAEVAQLTGEQVASIKWNEEPYANRGWIYAATLWDGVSYVDQYFCSNSHARRFAFVCAGNGYATESYREAERQRGNINPDRRTVG